MASPPEQGLFITKGMNVTMEEFSLSMNDKGDIETNKMILHTGLDMCPYWIDIAYSHLVKTEEIHKELIEANNDENSTLIGDLLQKEFTTGMQAVMAACIAIDAYYATIKEYSNVPNDLSRQWRENGTARYKQIAETFKRTFAIPQKNFLQIRGILKQCFQLRDRAVHPKAGTDQPVLYPEINRISDWRYSAFRYANAKAVVGHAISITYQTANKKINNNKPAFKVTCQKLVKEIDPVLSQWIERYGILFE